MKRILAIILAILMVATVFVGCNKEQAKDTSTELVPESGASLVVWAPEKASSVFQAQCDAFIKKYPDAKLKIEVKAQGEADAASNLLNDAEKAADVFAIPSDQIDQLINAEVILPVNTKLVEDVKTRNSAESVAAATKGDILYAFPETGDNGYYLVYDKSVISDEDVKTLEGVLEACKKAGKKFICNVGDGFFGCMLPFTGGLATNGIGEDGETQLFNDYDEDKVVDTLVAFAELFHKYEGTFTDDKPTKIYSGFAANPTTVAAGIDGSWNAADVASALGDNFGAVKLPTINVNGEDTQIISCHGYKFIGVNSYTKYPKAATLLADYLSGEECQLERAEKLYWGPSNNNAVKTDVVKNNVAVTAILDQSQYRVTQVNIIKPFWTPMGTLGAKLCKPGEKYDEETVRELFKETIANINE